MVELHRVLKPTGSIYLHCDPTASHYLKLLMDAVFGLKNFRNEIVWCYSIGGKSHKTFGRKHDVILWYTKSNEWTFNPDVPYVRVSRKPDSHMKVITDEAGVTWQEKTDAKTGKIYRYPLDKIADDYWLNMEQLNREDAERLGYPTQKPEALLERIIAASSNEGDMVLDPFCGCGTTVAVAERLKRHWIGIDITHLAISLMRHRLHDTFGHDLSPYEVIGDPKDLESARALAEENRYQFEWWALGLVDARPAQDKRKGADRGVDGYINFFDDNSGKAKTIIVQVKSGGVNRSYIATLNSDREREKAPIGILITLEEPTKPMLEEAATAGYYEPEHFPGYQYPRIQILTIKELLDGKEAQYPRMAPPATFKRAQRHRKSIEEQQRLV
jgi:site-specific DNA-methyltransferase (adenine-specific)